MEYNEPEWITQSLSPYDIAAINQGGCASGAYMPAVTYYQATKTMAEHGNDAIDLMRSIKQALDPKHVLNPGKIFHV